VRNGRGRSIENVKTAQVRQVRCRWCGKIFYICRSCFRGQAYCTDECREARNRIAHRKAQKEYRKTAKGKKAHREAENRRRMGLSKKNRKTMDDRSRESHYTFRKKNMRAGFHSREHAVGALGTEIKIGKCHYCHMWAVIVTEYA